MLESIRWYPAELIGGLPGLGVVRNHRQLSTNVEVDGSVQTSSDLLRTPADASWSPALGSSPTPVGGRTGAVTKYCRRRRFGSAPAIRLPPRAGDPRDSDVG